MRLRYHTFRAAFGKQALPTLTWRVWCHIKRRTDTSKYEKGYVYLITWCICADSDHDQHHHDYHKYNHTTAWYVLRLEELRMTLKLYTVVYFLSIISRNQMWAHLSITGCATAAAGGMVSGGGENDTCFRSQLHPHTDTAIGVLTVIMGKSDHFNLYHAQRRNISESSLLRTYLLLMMWLDMYTSDVQINDMWKGEYWP